MLLRILLCLWCFTSVRGLESLSEVSTPLPAAYQSIASTGSATLLTWVEGENIAYCVLTTGKCEGQSLTPGLRSFVVGCENYELFDVITATNFTLAIARFTAGGEKRFEIELAAKHPKDLTGLFTDNERSIVLWTSLSSSGDYDVYGCLLDSYGAQLRCDFVINSFSQGDQTSPSAAYENGSIYVAWKSTGYHAGVFGQKLTLDGNKIDTEVELVAERGYQSPVLVSGTLLVSQHSGVNSAATLGFLPLGTSRFIPISTVDEFHIFSSLFGLRVDSDLITLHSYYDFEGRGHILVQKVTIDGCLQSVYRSSTGPRDSHVSGKLLGATTKEVQFAFYDQVRSQLTVRTISNPRNSVCMSGASGSFPEWRTPSAVREASWKKIVMVSLSCLAFLLFVACVSFAVRCLCRWRRLKSPPPSPDIQQDSQGKDNSMVMFEVGTPELSPAKPS